MHPLRQSAWLIATLAGLWLVLALPARWAGGMAGLEGLTWAIGLCLLPGLMVLMVMVLMMTMMMMRTTIRSGNSGTIGKNSSKYSPKVI